MVFCGIAAVFALLLSWPATAAQLCPKFGDLRSGASFCL